MGIHSDYSLNGKEMNFFSNQLTEIEARLRTLIEDQAVRLVPVGGSARDLAFQLVDAMRAGVEADADGELIAPNHFKLAASPDLAPSLDDPTQLEELAGILDHVSQACGLHMAGPIAVQFIAQPNSVPGTIDVSAEVRPHKLTQTSTVEVVHSREASEVPPGLHLIVNGTRQYSLDATVVNIGRGIDNHLVIDDRRISRQHAQLRFIRGQYTIFDLDSSGGTWVNGGRIRQQALKPGDLISLAGVPLVYRQDNQLV